MGFLEERIVRGEKGFQRLLRRLLAMKQRIFNQRGISVQVDVGTTQVVRGFAEPRTTAALSGRIEQHPFSLHRVW